MTACGRRGVTWLVMMTTQRGPGSLGSQVCLHPTPTPLGSFGGCVEKVGRRWWRVVTGCGRRGVTWLEMMRTLRTPRALALASPPVRGWGFGSWSVAGVAWRPRGTTGCDR